MSQEYRLFPSLPLILISGIAILTGLYLTSLYNYLLFHSLVEIFSVVVAGGIFIVAWNSRSFMENNYLIFLGVAYLFIGGLDLLHTLAYKGMGVFPEYDANLPTQLWIAARFMESLALLIAPMFLNRRLKAGYVAAAYLAVFALILISIFAWDIFPTCFVEGQGLTLFKKISEYLIAFVLLGAAVLLIRKRDEFEQNVFRLIVGSILVTIMAELVFTFYISVYGVFSLIGHFLKIISFYLLYKALIVAGLVKPYDVLFRNLKKSENALRQERDNLEQALSEVKKLSGLLPICASCKKIRDDQGYWTEIEGYIESHSEADFSHGICPECMKKLYPAYRK